MDSQNMKALVSNIGIGRLSYDIPCEQLTCTPQPCDPESCNNKYIQPCRPKACKPISHSFINEGRIAGNTVYNCSYDTYVSGPRRKPIKHSDHLKMAGLFDDTTVHRMSYPLHCSQRVAKIVPRNHCLGGKGPMKKETTNNHDFYILCGDRRQKIVPRNNIRNYEKCPMASLTTNNCSYQAVCSDPVVSYKPKQCYNTPDERMEMTTVQRSSYKFKCPPEKMRTPWATRMAFCKPKERVENCTVYNQSFIEPGHYVPVDGSVCSGQQTCAKAPRTCCPVGCLATSMEAKMKSNHKKAHFYY